MRAWRSFYKVGQHQALRYNFTLERNKAKLTRFNLSNEMEMVNVGYEVYADGLTRVLRISERNDSRKVDKVLYSGAKIIVRVASCDINLSELTKQVSQKFNNSCLG